ncbi:uncharacterized protein LOC133178420 [Saccostrea echinata]|uniref:uncharacterized protein LOC133178420 n=1 Tax=Saccostrea echinata TaxID=191078 RepID=UPI002A8287BA|nr:uncharacterized protein LOC133178420 [Saccostrea echinata]
MEGNLTLDRLPVNLTNFSSLQELEWEDFLTNDIPIVVFLAILSVVGTVGNGHAFCVYYFCYTSSNHRTFVVALALIDFIACFVVIPFEIFDIRYKYTFTSSNTCKTFRYMNHCVVISSGLMLGVIAIERFRKACRPFLRQLSPKGAFFACLGTVFFSVLISIPVTVFYGSAEKEVGGFIGHNCQALPSFRKNLFYKMFNGFLLLLSTSVFVICTVVYIFVGRVLYKQMKFRMEAQQTHRGAHQSMINNDAESESSSVVLSSKEISSQGSRKSALRTLSSVSLGALNRLSTKRKKLGVSRSRRITVMFIVATGVSYIGVFPNSVILIIKAVNYTHYKTLSAKLGFFIGLLLRGYFLSNVTNPIVYSFFDDRFRRECKKLYSKLKCLKP